MGFITIKQPSAWIDYSVPHWVEPYDHTLVKCECGEWMEKGMGLCDKCIDRVSREMQEPCK